MLFIISVQLAKEIRCWVHCLWGCGWYHNGGLCLQTITHVRQGSYKSHDFQGWWAVGDSLFYSRPIASKFTFKFNTGLVWYISGIWANCSSCKAMDMVSFLFRCFDRGGYRITGDICLCASLSTSPSIVTCYRVLKVGWFMSYNSLFFNVERLSSDFSWARMDIFVTVRSLVEISWC
jgi:hypothetical protein